MSTSTSAEIPQHLHTLDNLLRTAHEAAEAALLLQNDPKQYGMIHLTAQELRKARAALQSLKQANYSALVAAIDRV